MTNVDPKLAYAIPFTDQDMGSRIQTLEDHIAMLGQMIKQQQHDTTVHEPKPADPRPIGLVGFAMSTIMLGYVKAELVEPESASLLTVWGFTIGGIVQLIAGILEQKQGGVFGSWAFTLYGCSWLATGLFDMLIAIEVLQQTGPMGQCAKASMMVIFSFMLTVLCFHISIYTIIMMSSVTLLFLLEAIAFATGSSPLMRAAGCFGIVSGVMAFILAFAINCNTLWQREVFKLGEFKYKPVAASDALYAGTRHDAINEIGNINSPTRILIN